MKVIITAPSLDTRENVSGVSEVARFIIAHAASGVEYIHFRIGKRDTEAGGLMRSIRQNIVRLRDWKALLRENKDALIHYSYPLDAKSIVRDCIFMGYARRHGRRMVIHVHGGLYLTKQSRPWLIERIMRRVFTWDYPIIVLSEQEKEMLTRDFGAKNVTVLPNCVEIPTLSQQTPALSSHINILYIGRVEVNKGFDYLLPAMARLKAKGISFTLHIAGKEQGDADYIGRLKAILGDRFIYEGIVGGESKDALMRRCNVFLLPSLYEGLPMSLLECMSYGMVPVTTNVGSISSVVKDKETGLFIGLRSADSIVDAIEWISTHASEAAEIGCNAHECIKEHFSPEMYMKTLNNIYTQLPETE